MGVIAFSVKNLERLSPTGQKGNYIAVLLPSSLHGDCDYARHVHAVKHVYAEVYETTIKIRYARLFVVGPRAGEEHLYIDSLQCAGWVFVRACVSPCHNYHVSAYVFFTTRVFDVECVLLGTGEPPTSRGRVFTLILSGSWETEKRS